jgi:hypothetical protein
VAHGPSHIYRLLANSLSKLSSGWWYGLAPPTKFIIKIYSGLVSSNQNTKLFLKDKSEDYHHVCNLVF